MKYNQLHGLAALPLAASVLGSAALGVAAIILLVDVLQIEKQYGYFLGLLFALVIHVYLRKITEEAGLMG